VIATILRKLVHPGGTSDMLRPRMIRRPTPPTRSLDPQGGHRAHDAAEVVVA